jgi:hypothetical protein
MNEVDISKVCEQQNKDSKVIISATTDENEDPVTVEELMLAMKYNQNKKAPHYDGEKIIYILHRMHYTTDSWTC